MHLRDSCSQSHGGCRRAGQPGCTLQAEGEGEKREGRGEWRLGTGEMLK